MATKPSTQSKARATSGALELAKKRQDRTFKKVLKTKAGTDAGVDADSKWVSAWKQTKKLNSKQQKARTKVKLDSMK
jgi:hypothetical protein